MRMIRINTEANGLVETRRKEIGGTDHIEACKQAIHDVVAKLTTDKELNDDEVEQLNAHLKTTFLDELQKVKDNVDEQMKRPE